MRSVTLAAIAVIVFLVIGVLWVDEGEVITLTVTDEQGHRSKTGLWVVDIDGRTYLRAGSPRSAWLRRLREQPLAEFERAGVSQPVIASPRDDPTLRLAVSWAMREKYGLVDAILVGVIDHSGAVPILVEPVGESPAPSGERSPTRAGAP